MTPETIVAFFALAGVTITAYLSYRGGSTAARELTEGAMAQVREMRIDLDNETEKRRALEKRVSEQDDLIIEILDENKTLHKENDELRRKVKELERWINDVEDSGVLKVNKDNDG